MEIKRHTQNIIIIDVFLYGGGNGNKYYGSWRGGTSYGIKWGEARDIIECELNLETMRLSFIVNDENQGVAFILNKEKTYHFVFCSDRQTDSIRVISETIEKTSLPSFVCDFLFVQPK